MSANIPIPESNNHLFLEPQDFTLENISMHAECRFAFQENIKTRETDVGLPVAEITMLRSTNFPEVTSYLTTNSIK